MKPSGSSVRKNARSSGASIGPAQPKIAARGLLISGTHENAADIAALQLAAHMSSRGDVADRAGLDAVIDAALAKIGARPSRIQPAEQIAVRLLQFLPFLPRRVLAAQGTELQAIAGDGGGGRRRCRWRGAPPPPRGGRRPARRGA